MDLINHFKTLCQYYQQLTHNNLTPSLSQQLTSITQCELSYAFKYFTLQFYGKPFKIVTVNDPRFKQIMRQILNNLTPKQKLIRWTVDNIHILIQDMVHLYPYQLSIIHELSQLQDADILLKKVLDLYISKMDHRLLKSNTVNRLKSKLLALDYQLKIDHLLQENKNQEFDFQTILEETLEKTPQYTMRGQRNALSQQLLEKQSFLNKEFSLLQDLFYTFFDDLSKYIHELSIQIRYVLKKMSDRGNLRLVSSSIIHSIMLQMYLQHDSHLESQHYIKNVKTISQFMILFNGHQEHNFKNVNMQKLFKYFRNQTHRLLAQLLYIHQSNIKHYEKRRQIFCVSFDAVKRLGYEFDQSEGIFFVSSIDVMHRDNTKQYKSKLFEFLKSNKDSPEYFMKVCGDKLQEEISIMQQHIKNKELVLRKNYTQTCDYKNKINALIRNYSKVIQFIENERKCKQVNKIWQSIRLDPGLSIIVHKQYIQLEQEYNPKAYSIISLDEFIQYFFNSEAVQNCIHTGTHLNDINAIYRQLISKLRNALKEIPRGVLLLNLFDRKITSLLYRHFHINQGTEADTRILQKIYATEVTLHQIELHQFADQEYLFMDLINQYELIATDPYSILEAYSSIVRKLQYVMKICNSQFVLTGDHVISIMYFLIVKKKVSNLASQINFIQAFRNDDQDNGSSDYTLTLLKAVQQLILTK